MNGTTDTGWMCGTCGRLNFSHRTACKVCKGTVRATTPPPAAFPSNSDVLSEKTSASHLHPFLLFALIAGAVGFMLSICMPMVYLSLPLMAMSPSTSAETFMTVPLVIIGLGVVGVLVLIAVGARFLDRERTINGR